MEKLLTFFAGKNKYAIDAENVIEILQNKTEIKSLPGSEDYVAGMSQIRDKIIKIIDLGGFLGVENNEPKYIIDVVSDDKQIGLLVEDVEKILDKEELEMKNFSFVENNNVFKQIVVKDKDIYLELNAEEICGKHA